MKTLLSYLALAALTLGAGCYADTTKSFDPHTLDTSPGWHAIRDVPMVQQKQEMDCGAAAAAMILAYWKHPVDEEAIWADAEPVSGHGITAGWLRDYLKQQGLTAFLVHGTYDDLTKELSKGHPILVGVMKVAGDQGISHYEIIIGTNEGTHTIVLLNPARKDWRQSTFDDFMAEWKRSEFVMIPAHGAEPASAPSP